MKRHIAMAGTVLFVLMQPVIAAPFEYLLPLPQKIDTEEVFLYSPGRSWARGEIQQNPLIDLGLELLSQFSPEQQDGQNTYTLNVYIDPELNLPRDGYTIDAEEDSITITGRDRRGAFYGMTLRQMAEETEFAVADVTDYPVWQGRYAGDYGPGKEADYLELAKVKIGGFAVQWRTNYDNFSIDGKFGQRPVKEVFDEIRKLSDMGMMDFMFLLHIYAFDGVRTRPVFNCANPEDIALLIERCRWVGNAGFKHLMICVDDWTPKVKGRYVCPTEQEREVFNDSVGRAHGTMMKQLYETIHKEFPDMEVSFVPPTYSTKQHDLSDPASYGYLQDFDAVAPREIYLVWTGPQICSQKISKEDYNDFTCYLSSGRKLVMWDNSQCFDPDMPGWTTQFYDSFSEDSDGIIFLNAHTFGKYWSAPYIRTAGDYVWNPKQYDPERSYRAAIRQCRSLEAAEMITEKRKLVLELAAANERGDREKVLALLPIVKKILPELAAVGLDVAQQENMVKRVEERVSVVVPEITVPILNTEVPVGTQPDTTFWARAAEFVLAKDDDSAPGEASPTIGKIAYADGSLFLKLDMTQPRMAEVTPAQYRKHDDTVFLNQEAVEIFIQPNNVKVYGHFCIDPYGNYYDERCAEGNDTYDPDWEVYTERHKDGWTAVLRFPMVELEPLQPQHPSEDQVWFFNVIRCNFQEPVTSFSSTHNQGYHTTDFFGMLRFSR